MNGPVLKITKVPAMTPDGTFMLAPEDVESVRMQVLRHDVRYTLEGYEETFYSFGDEDALRLRKVVLELLADDRLLDAFIARMDDGACWSMADLILARDGATYDWDYLPAEQRVVCELLEKDDDDEDGPPLPVWD